jgi:hypothetical protein
VTPTRNTDERFAIRTLVDNREKGLSLAISFFFNTIVTAADVGRVYAGMEVDDEKWIIIKRVLRERLAKDPSAEAVREMIDKAMKEQR